MASVRLGRIDGQFVPFPTHDQLEESDLDLIVSGTGQSVCMIEGFAREMPEDDMADGHRVRPRRDPRDLRHAAGIGREGRAGEDAVRAAAGRRPVRPAAREVLRATFKAAKQTPGKQARAEAVAALKDAGRWPR